MSSCSRIFPRSRAARLAIAALSGALLLATAPPEQSTYNRKLSGPFQLPPTIAGSIVQFALTPVGAHVLYRADQEAAGDFALHRVASDGSTAPVRLADWTYSGSLQITPDGQHAVFQDGNQLKAVAVDGSAPASTIQTLVPPTDFAVSPDSSRVVYRGNSPYLQAAVLYSGPIDGSAFTFLGPPGPGSIPEFRVAQSTQDVAFLVSVDPAYRLMRVPIDGSSGAVEIASGADSFGYLRLFHVTTAGRVLFQAGSGLHSVPLDGSSPAVQIASSVPTWDASVTVTPDETRVLYRVGGIPGHELESAPIDGSTPAVRLNPSLPPGATVWSFAVDPTGAFAVYRADQLVAGQFELFRVPVDGSAAPVRLNAPLVAGGDVADYAISPDGLRVVYRADQDDLSVLELYSVPSSGGTPVRLSATPVPSGDVQLFRISADSSQVLYWADQDVDELVELFRAPIDGSSAPSKLSGTTGLPSQVAEGAGNVVHTLGDALLDGALGNALVSSPVDGSGPAVTLNDPLPLGPHAGDVVSTPAEPNAFALTPDGRRAVYLADQDVDEEFELYAAPTNGGAASTQVNAPLVAGGDVLRWWIAADSRRAAYLADGDADGVVELYGASLDGTVPAVKLNGPLVAGGNVSGSQPGQSGTPVIAPDGSRVAYRADASTDEAFELFSAPFDGSAPAVRLNGPLAPGGDVLSMAMTTTRVVYLADQSANDLFELFSVPAVGGSAVRISAPLATGGDVTDFALTADGAHAVYRADQVNGRFELFAVPADGSAAAGAISGTLPTGADVEPDFALAATGERVVYRLLAGSTARLFSAPRDGSAAPVELSGPLVAGGSVFGFRLSPGGAWAVYSADQDIDERFEIYAVPSDGSAPPARVNGALVEGDLYPTDYMISPDSTRVAYLARQESVVRELFCAPISGGASVKLSAGGQPYAFTFTPDGRHVLYLANEEVPSLRWLYRVAVSGGGRSRVHPPLPWFATIYAFAVTSDGGRVVYRADQDASGLYELYSSQIVRGAQRADPP